MLLHLVAKKPARNEGKKERKKERKRTFVLGGGGGGWGKMEDSMRASEREPHMRSLRAGYGWMDGYRWIDG